ncbi:hypothetical protein LTR36_000067 [Oleoguttula mirabilis]|uniref:Xylanolytic transcriptional activator regulatory domain-containing protein n=1 Tax=Oleoguttula mirabilis TaxID=1507867 RepID=A0AAV9JXI0_9PEZI|nr:hypothetical protein LTR36_000067 [Oleoguttula mirabilis]
MDTSGATARDTPQSASHSTGGKRFFSVWVDKKEWEALVQQRNEAAAEGASVSQRAVSGYVARSDQRPHPAVLRPLIDVYFEKIHPILPLLDEAEFRQQHAGGLVPEPLAHALCLVAAKDADAEPHLRLGQSASIIAPREFCSKLHASVMGALKAPCRYDKVTLIRILALASMHNEGADGAEEASMLLSQAIHHAQTLCIHLGQQFSTATGADLSMKRLFWCLYALDRASSTINGRPIIMGDADIAIEPFAPGESSFPAFETWLRITDMLNKIIAFYRPHAVADASGWEDHYPGLEEIIDDVHGWDLPQSTHSTLHLYYLAVAILSHRSRGIKQIPRGTHSNVRQRLCSGEIIRLMDSTYSRDLHGLPFIPYAVSLALSVAYQHLRQSQYSHQQADAHQAVRQCTKVLQNLRRTWSSADTMAALAKKVLDELDRAPNLASFRVPRAPKAAPVFNNDGSAAEDPPRLPTPDGVQSRQSAPMPDTSDCVVTGPSPAAPDAAVQRPTQDELDLFDGMDDVFSGYLDLHNPNLDDFAFIDDLQPFDWNEAAQQGA